METRPTPLDALSAVNGGLHDFRISAPTEMAALFRTLQDGNVALNLNPPQGGALTTTLWASDATRGVLSFSAEPQDPQLPSLLDANEAVVVGYLDEIKVQFDVHDLVLVHGARASALNAAYPREVFRFQRRNSYRVRPLINTSPLARLRHPMIPEMELELRVIDVSVGGCALLLPGNVPSMAPGVRINQVLIELDADTRFLTALRLQHVSSINGETGGVRLGCEMVQLESEAERALQRFIDQTQKRRRVLAPG
jgi:flagellar brake protein